MLKVATNGKSRCDLDLAGALCLLRQLPGSTSKADTTGLAHGLGRCHGFHRLRLRFLLMDFRHRLQEPTFVLAFAQAPLNYTQTVVQESTRACRSPTTQPPRLVSATSSQTSERSAQGSLVALSRAVFLAQLVQLLPGLSVTRLALLPSAERRFFISVFRSARLARGLFSPWPASAVQPGSSTHTHTHLHSSLERVIPTAVLTLLYLLSLKSAPWQLCMVDRGVQSTLQVQERRMMSPPSPNAP